MARNTKLIALWRILEINLSSIWDISYLLCVPSAAYQFKTIPGDTQFGRDDLWLDRRKLSQQSTLIADVGDLLKFPHVGTTA